MILSKPYTNKEYAMLALYCNQNNSHIVDKGNYLESIENNPISIEEQNQIIRNQRYIRMASEADPLKYDYEEALALNADNVEELKQKWLNTKQKIREELPYIVEE